ncbi:MAG TPA: 23S rRNA (pseudouridine(1915)-N(3))-methyltransferase RlmH [Gemmatimonadaceae bacterium]|nr:23S rRNA (pseudouridine(1915)-N(3))-methyltransferase RlmH [Gemmatimonadaceae bacterium]
MKVVVAAVGKPRDAALAAAIREYEGRAAHYWPLDVIEVKEEPARGVAPAQVMQREAARLAERLPASGTLVLCQPGGRGFDSEAFAAMLQDHRERAQDLAFVIGGAFGIGAALAERPHRAMSLAPWTLPHELARLVLMEQIYRAGTIVRGEPYHK